MKIYGIGVDIVNTNRFKKMSKNDKIIYRLFNQTEISKCKKLPNKENCYAKKFAAKEAFSKAIGTGISNGINFNEIVITNNKLGKPYIILMGNTKKVIKKSLNNKKFDIFLSLSDEKKFAIAMVIVTIWIKKFLK